MLCKKVIYAYLFLIIALFSLRVNATFAQVTDTPTPTQTPTPTSDNSGKIKELQDQIKQYEAKIADLQGQEKTLSSQIAIMTNQIKLTELRISDTKQKIANLDEDINVAKDKISGLQNKIDYSTKALIGRIVGVYQVGKVQSWELFLTSSNISNFFTRLTYLKMVQIYDKKNIYAAEQSKVSYANQKNILEDKQVQEEALKKQLEGYTSQLDQEKKSKQGLLDLTKNDEKKYQDLLARTRAEFQAIQGIVAGQGEEAQVGSIKEGDRIASIISGVSTCSNGTHLHFEVANNGSRSDPSGYLSSKDVDLDTCWLNYGCDSVSFSGSWQWPINGKPRITQGYGMTGYARWGAYGGSPHTGIDMVSDDLSVKAVKDGTLYRGSIACGGGRLRYVKVQQDSGIETYYLHINYAF